MKMEEEAASGVNGFKKRIEILPTILST